MLSLHSSQDIQCIRDICQLFLSSDPPTLNNVIDVSLVSKVLALTERMLKYLCERGFQPTAV